MQKAILRDNALCAARIAHDLNVILSETGPAPSGRWS